MIFSVLYHHANIFSVFEYSTNNIFSDTQLCGVFAPLKFSSLNNLIEPRTSFRRGECESRPKNYCCLKIQSDDQVSLNFEIKIRNIEI